MIVYFSINIGLFVRDFLSVYSCALEYNSTEACKFYCHNRSLQSVGYTGARSGGRGEAKHLPLHPEFWKECKIK
jgi:hypothetical protein